VLDYSQCLSCCHLLYRCEKLLWDWVIINMSFLIVKVDDVCADIVLGHSLYLGREEKWIITALPRYSCVCQNLLYKDTRHRLYNNILWAFTVTNFTVKNNCACPPRLCFIASWGNFKTASLLFVASMVNVLNFMFYYYVQVDWLVCALDLGVTDCES
jgi:hypothetical protein